MVSTPLCKKAREKIFFPFRPLPAVTMRARAATITGAMIGLVFFQALSAAGALAQSTLTICGGPPICGATSDTLLIKSTDVFGNTSVDVQSTFIEGSSVGPEILTGT